MAIQRGQFTIDVGGDLSYEDLVAEIYLNDEFVGLINQDQGFDSLELVVSPRDNGGNWQLKLKEFEEVLLIAKQRLRELRKNPPETK